MMIFYRRRRDRMHISIKIKYLAIHILVSKLNLQDYKTQKVENGFKYFTVKSGSLQYFYLRNH